MSMVDILYQIAVDDIRKRMERDAEAAWLINARRRLQQGAKEAWKSGAWSGRAP